MRVTSPILRLRVAHSHRSRQESVRGKDMCDVLLLVEELLAEG
ncbi:hypothetical protein [Rhodococcus spelaei]|nr:hypothetical protein [Rhodococcus spelaei]